MKTAAKITAALAGLALVGGALAGCANSATKPAAEPEPTHSYLTELPASARSKPGPVGRPEVPITWLVYPVDFKCAGTEGCPNDYRAYFGEPGPVLPEGVEYYDPKVHTWVRPAVDHGP